MDQPWKEATLADIAHFLDVAHKRNLIREAECGDLTLQTVSKRHLRILIVLAKALETTEATWVHASVAFVRTLVAELTNKTYSTGDIRACLFDLSNRGYVNHVYHEEHGDVFAILPKGIELLESYEAAHGTTYRESTTPNSHPPCTH